MYWRERDPKQSSDFSFTRFLVPHLMNFEGWAIFMDCDMLCQDDIANLWNQRDERYSIMCVKHEHVPKNKTKFLGEPQTSYPKKNWSSLMLMNCPKCRNLNLEFVNNASGLDLHRFNWLDGDEEIGEIKGTWNSLVEDFSNNDSDSLIHWTLGGPWFKELRDYNNILTNKWFKAREESIKLYD